MLCRPFIHTPQFLQINELLVRPQGARFPSPRLERQPTCPASSSFVGALGEIPPPLLPSLSHLHRIHPPSTLGARDLSGFPFLSLSFVFSSSPWVSFCLCRCFLVDPSSGANRILCGPCPSAFSLQIAYPALPVPNQAHATTQVSSNIAAHRPLSILNLYDRVRR